jgi:hypothetical protein
METETAVSYYLSPPLYLTFNQINPLYIIEHYFFNKHIFGLFY